MTPTEELLTNALAEEAAGIRADSLRPLCDQSSGRRRDWPRPVVAVGAAIAVFGVLALAFAASTLLASAPPFADLGTAKSPPPYVVFVDPNDNLVVQSTATGQSTDLVQPPEWVNANSFADAALASAPGGRTFFVAYNDWDTLRTHLFRFSLTSSGQVSGFSYIPVSGLVGLTMPSLAVSPDGSEVAIAGVGDQLTSIMPSSGPPKLVVVTLSTGLVRTWQGLAETRNQDQIQNLSWVGDRLLRFLVTTCPGGRAWPFNTQCEASPTGPTGPETAREWMLDIPPKGQLSHGKSVLRLPDSTVQALPGRGADTVLALTLTRAGVRIGLYVGRAGRLAQTLYQGETAGSTMGYAELSVDPSGRYLLINEEIGSIFGWIRDGQLSKLPVHGRFGDNEVIAAAW